MYYVGEDFKNLDIFLIALCKFIGITDVPQLQHRKLIMSFLSDNYSDFSKEEIEKAMNLALCFKIEVEEIKHFGQLTPQWIASILNSYKVHRGKEINNYRALLEEKSLQQPVKISKAEQEKNILESISSVFNHYKANYQIVDYGSIIFFFLEEKKIINLSIEEKKIKYETARDNLVRDKAKIKTNYLLHPSDISFIKVGSIVKDIDKLNKDDDGVKGSIQREARRISLSAFFDKVIEDKLDIIEFIINFKDAV